MAGLSVTPPGFEGYVDDWQMSPARIVGDLVFLTGMTGAGPDGTVSGDPEIQIRLAFERTQMVLGAAGARMVEMTSYHVRLADHIDLFRRIRRDFVSAPYPAWTAIEVAGFVTPGTLVELRIVGSRALDGDV